MQHMAVTEAGEVDVTVVDGQLMLTLPAVRLSMRLPALTDPLEVGVAQPASMPSQQRVRLGQLRAATPVGVQALDVHPQPIAFGSRQHHELVDIDVDHASPPPPTTASGTDQAVDLPSRGRRPATRTLTEHTYDRNPKAEECRESRNLRGRDPQVGSTAMASIEISRLRGS